MAKVVVKLFTTLRELTGEKQIEVRGDAVAEIVEKVVEKYGSKFRDTLLDKETGRIKPFYNILVNGIRLSLREGLDTEVKDGDVIAIFPPVGGG
ncbi:MAG: MoaD family protein [Proteobacteria bacterium]|nr:MoaD family protein [Pseudomonadota bacterium]